MRRLPVLSPSKMDLSLLCSFAWSEMAPEWPSEPENEAMAWGNAVGLVGERLVAGDDPVTAANVAAPQYAVDELELAACAKFMAPVVASLDKPQAELALAWDYVTGKARQIERVTHRDYGQLGPNEIGMTLDLVGWAGSELHVIDWKTGRSAQKKDARTAMQLAAYAVGAAALFGASSVVVTFAHVDESGVRPDIATLDALDLGAISERIREMFLKHDSTPKPGTHCDGEYCPIRTVCPDRVAMAATVAPKFDPLAPIETEEQARAAFFALKSVESVAASVWEKVKAFAKRTPIDLGNGSVYAQIECSGRESITVTPEARELLLELAPNALEYSASKAGIGRAVSAKEARKIEAALREMGALRKGAPYQKFEVVKRKEEAA